MNTVNVYIKGQEDKELISFLRYFPSRIKNIGMDAVFDRQIVYDYNVVFSCIPASSPERNEMRNRHFSELVCKFSGAIDGFSHVSVIGERTAVHGTKIKKEERAKRINEQNNIEIDADFFKNKEVCIWDDVVTTGASFNAYVSQLEQAGAHVTNGIFLAKTSYKYVLK